MMCRWNWSLFPMFAVRLVNRYMVLKLARQRQPAPQRAIGLDRESGCPLIRQQAEPALALGDARACPLIGSVDASSARFAAWLLAPGLQSSSNRAEEQDMPFDNTTWAEPKTKPRTTTAEADLKSLKAIWGRLREPGAWTQHEMGFGGKHCIVGWVGQVTANAAMEARLIRHLVAALPKAWEPPRETYEYQRRELILFNDSKQTTKRRVVQVVCRAIRKLEA